jgi:phage-related protein
MGFFDSIGDFFSDAFGTIKDGIGDVFHTGTDILKTGIGAVTVLGGKVVDGVSGIGNKVIDTAGGIANRVGNIAENTIDKTTSFLTSPLTLLVVAGAAIILLPKLLEKY